MSHPFYTLLMALLVSTAMAMIDNRGARERLYVAVRMFAWCAIAVVGGGWLMDRILRP